MFDIREYYQSGRYRGPDVSRDLADIDLDLSYDIDSLLRSRLDRLYLCDLFKHSGHTIEIVHPRTPYPGSRNIPLNPDRVRFLLSFYPDKRNLGKVDKIILRPRYIESGQVELVALFLRSKRILVMYLCQPHHYTLPAVNPSEKNHFVSVELDRLMARSMGDQNTDSAEGRVIHPLWHILSMVRHEQNTAIDKFFYRNSNPNNRIRMTLQDISSFYSRQGY